MQTSRKYSFFGTLLWSKKYILIFLVIDTIPVLVYNLFSAEWLLIPWQPISLVGIGVAFYLGFKNNSSYDRLWEGRKIWGGIVNSSRSFTIMIRDYVNNEFTKEDVSQSDLHQDHIEIIHRHIAWLKALTFQLREKRNWEHHSDITHNSLRIEAGIHSKENHFTKLKPYLSNEDYEYVMKKGNTASHILSLQSKALLKLKLEEKINTFNHIELMKQLKSFYDLQGKSERIKNFPFPRRYASVNFFFVWIFICLLPFGMLTIFLNMNYANSTWLAIPFSVLVSWVFIMMELVGEYSENPFEGLFNDVPITAMSRSIEIDIRQMLEETDLPDEVEPIGKHGILV